MRLALLVLLAACSTSVSESQIEQHDFAVVGLCNSTGECPNTTGYVCVKKDPVPPPPADPEEDYYTGECMKPCTTNADCPAGHACVDGVGPQGEAVRYCEGYYPGNDHPPGMPILK